MTRVGAFVGQPDLSRTRYDPNYRLSFLFDYLWVVLAKEVLQSLAFKDMTVEILTLRKVEETLFESVFRDFFCLVKESRLVLDKRHLINQARSIAAALAPICVDVLSRSRSKQ